ncbi:MAG: hypothetical protein AAGB02_01050 [Pseudomonadota bacterium]
MRLQSLCRSLGLTLSLCIGLTVISTPAFAQNDYTPAGTNVQNTFSLTFDVGGVTQPTVDNTATPTEFTVDRRVEVTVTGVQDASVASGAADERLVYGVRNTGNDNHSYDLTVEEATGDVFDTDPTRSPRYDLAFYPDTNGDGILQAAEIAGAGTPYTLAALGDIAPDTTVWITVTANIPTGLTAGDTSDVYLVAEAREPSAWSVTSGPTASPTPTQGAVLTAAGSNTITGVADNVFTDADGPATADAATDARHSDGATYTIIAANLSATKTVTVIASDGGTLANCSTLAVQPGAQFAIPGACVEYVITVTNTAGAAMADNIDLSDVLPDEVEFAGSAQATFTTPGTITDPTGGCTTSCEVRLDDAVLTPTPTVDAVGTFTIRVLVR